MAFVGWGVAEASLGRGPQTICQYTNSKILKSNINSNIENISEMVEQIELFEVVEISKTCVWLFLVQIKG